MNGWRKFCWGFAGLLLMGLSVGARAQTTVEYVHTDALGSPVAVTNATGTVIERTDYEPYGSMIGKPNYSGVGFTGHVQDGETGLTYMQQRYYDPMCGCFLSIDPVTAYSSKDMRFFNRYAYAFNNPYRFSDPDGRCPTCDRFGDSYRDMSSEERDGLAKVTAAIGVAVLTEVATTKGLGLIGKGFLAFRAYRAERALNRARTARDGLAKTLAPQGRKAPATVTGGVNTKTGEVTAKACGGGKCAEDHVADALGGKKEDIRFTEATRPRTGEQVPVCETCEAKYGRDAFPKETTKFKSDQ